MKKNVEVHDTKKDEFLKTYLTTLIFPFGMENKEKLGYTWVLVDKEFSIESMKFIEGRFNRKKFWKLENKLTNPHNDKVHDVFNLYFEILYESDHTKIMFYRSFLILSTNDYSRFKLNDNSDIEKDNT